MSYIVNMSEKCEPGDISPQLSSLDCWDYSIELECLRGPEDLQLAAELGKTLLERNKELETSLKQHQNVIEDQTQEIEYLTKQTVALREVNDSRLRIYEQLEVSIHDLERANHRLTLDVAADKKQIKSLCANIDVLESRNEELQATVEQLTSQIDAYKRKCERIGSTENGGILRNQRNRHTVADVNEDIELSHDKQVQCDSTTKPEIRSCNAETSTSPIIRSSVISSSACVNRKDGADVCDGSIADNEQMLSQLRDLRAHQNREQRRLVELEEQVSALVQENQVLETQLLNASTRDEAMKSMHDELNTLDEVRHGQLCRRCLRNAEMTDDMSILDTEEEDDDNLSMIDAITSETRYRSSVSLNIEQDSNHPATQSNNLYRDLVEKYEALLAVNRDHRKPSHPLSLQEELQMSGDFNNLHSNKDTDEESGHGDSMNSFDKNINIKNNAKNRKAASQTPTDFSEAETSSSGFADETSNKSTQTDGRPGSFLCTIADGDDCKFSIYDDASPIDSRFRNRPEYRELFKEIFTVLKKAAENKDEGEELPLLDDCTPIACIPKVPPVTPATEDFPTDFLNDNESVTSAMSDVSSHSIEPTTVVENVPAVVKETPPKMTPKKAGNKKEAIPATMEKYEKYEKEEKIPTLTPYKREPLEYVSVSVNVRKKSSSKKNNKKQFIDRSDSPVLPLSPRISYLSNGAGGGARRRKEFRGNTASDANQVWNGSTLQFWSSNRNVSSPTPSQCSNKSGRQDKSSWDFKPSTASQDLNKLKRLDLSYAEVLRNADIKKKEAYGKSAVRRK